MLFHSPFIRIAMPAKSILTALLTIALLGSGSIHAQQNSHLPIAKVFHIASTGGWDYLAVNGSKLYVSHGTQVNILDKQTGDSIGIIPNTTGVHGIAFDNNTGKGFTSNGKINSVTVFDLSSGKVLGEITTGQNPDAIMYEPVIKKIITCNGRSKDLSIIDPVSQKLVATVPLGGKPETAVSDEAGKLYVNIEDKNEIAVVDLQQFTVLHHWPVTPGEAPAGLAIDRASKRLFAGCDNKLLTVLDASSGKLVSQLPIGDGCDGVAFDNASKTIYAANGEGTLTLIKEKSADSYAVTGNSPTKKGARTIALDEATHTVYLPTAELEPAKPSEHHASMKPGTFQVLVIPVASR